MQKPSFKSKIKMLFGPASDWHVSNQPRHYHRKKKINKIVSNRFVAVFLHLRFSSLSSSFILALNHPLADLNAPSRHHPSISLTLSCCLLHRIFLSLRVQDVVRVLRC